MVFAEHRFYGESLPFGANYSFNWPELGLLTVDQATADFANLLHHLKTVEYEIPDAPVICFGGKIYFITVRPQPGEVPGQN